MRRRIAFLGLAMLATFAVVQPTAHSSAGRALRPVQTGRWERTGGDYDRPVAALAIDPILPSTIYAGNTDGVAKTTNGGRTWRPANGGLSSQDVRALAVDPSDPRIVFAGVSDHTDNGGVFKSIDRARTWAPSSQGLPGDTVITGFAFDPSDSRTLYAANDQGAPQVYKSTDGGLNWAPASSGLPLFNNGVRSLAIDPTDPLTVYAGTDDLRSSGDGVYKTTDGGNQWEAANSAELAEFHVFALAVDPSDHLTVYAGAASLGGDSPGAVFKTTDGGASWTNLTDASGVLSLVIDPLRPSVVYAGTNGGGVLKSPDGGLTWKVVNAGLSNLNIYSMAIDPVHTRALYAGSNGGVDRTISGGATWSIVLASGFFQNITTLAVATSDANTLYAGTGSQGVFKTTDGARTWVPLNADIPNTQVHSLVVHPTDPMTAYAGLIPYSEGAPPAGLYRTTDGGVTWLLSDQGITTDDILALAIDASDPATVYAGTDDGVFKTTDGGASWSSSSLGIPPAFFVYGLAIDPSNPAIVYAGTQNIYSWEANDDGVFKSTDAGATWIRMSRGIGGGYGFPSGSSVYALAIDPTAPLTIYAAASCVDDPYQEECYETKIYKSVDGAATWTSVLDIPSLRFSSIAIDPSNSSTVWAGHYGQLGVYRTPDAGSHWMTVNDGLEDLFIFALAVRPVAPFTVYAGTLSGVFAFQG